MPLFLPSVPLSGGTLTGPLVIGGGTVTASAPVLDLSQTWNNAAAGFEGISLNFTNTSSAIGSFPLILKSSGTAVFSVRRDGVFGGAGECRTSAQFGIGASGFGNASDTIWLRDAANTWGMRNGANAQTLNVYGTYTDASNYRRIRSTMSTGGAATIAAEGLGTGVSGNTLSFSTDGTSIATMDLNGFNLNAGHIQMVEVAAPSAPGSNKGRLYLEDNGSGKTKLMIRFNTGAAQQIAIEP